ncbi:phosphoglycerate mutase family protein [Bacillus wiedmannii]
MCELQSPLYVVRHGISSGNEPDSSLTLEGKEQAKQVANFLLNKLGSSQVIIVSSPYKRAKQTACEISRTMGIEYSEEIRLKERELGDTSNIQDIWQEIEKDFENEERKFPEGESNLEVSNRIREMLTDWKSNGVIGEDSPIIVITHRITMTLLMQQFDSTIGYNHCRNMSNPDVYIVNSTMTDEKVERIWQSPI